MKTQVALPSIKMEINLLVSSNNALTTSIAMLIIVTLCDIINSHTKHMPDEAEARLQIDCHLCQGKLD